MGPACATNHLHDHVSAGIGNVYLKESHFKLPPAWRKMDG